MIEDRIALSAFVALALARDHVQELRAIELPEVGQSRYQRIEIVAIDRPDVIETEFLEQRARGDHALDVFFRPLGKLQHRRHRAEYFLTGSPCRRVKASRYQPGEIVVQRAYIL